MTVRSRRIGRVLLVALVAMGVLFLSGCAVYGGGPQSVNEPHGDSMRKIWNLFVPIFWMSVVVFVIVQGILIYAVIKFRRKPGQEIPHALHGNTKLEIAWTIAPALILAVIAVPTLTTIVDLAKDPGDEAVTVRVIGHQWWWEFQYPDPNNPEGPPLVVTANELHIPVDQPVRLEMTSADVLHSFWPAQLAGKQDVVPGQTNLLSFTAESVGTYSGQCYEFCGAQHANMAFLTVVESQQDFEQWLEDQQQPAADISGNPEALKGQEAFFDAKNLCISCHAIQGHQVTIDGQQITAEGQTGPNLTHVGSRQILAGGVLENSEENLARWIQHSNQIKPENLMGKTLASNKNVEITEEEANAIAAYLWSLK